MLLVVLMMIIMVLAVKKPKVQAERGVDEGNVDDVDLSGLASPLCAPLSRFSEYRCV